VIIFLLFQDERKLGRSMRAAPRHNNIPKVKGDKVRTEIHKK